MRSRYELVNIVFFYFSFLNRTAAVSFCFSLFFFLIFPVCRSHCTLNNFLPVTQHLYKHYYVIQYASSRSTSTYSYRITVNQMNQSTSYKLKRKQNTLHLLFTDKNAFPLRSRNNRFNLPFIGFLWFQKLNYGNKQTFFLILMYLLRH